MTYRSCRATAEGFATLPGAGTRPGDAASPGEAGLREGECDPLRAGLGAGPRPFRRPLPEPRSGGGGRARDTASPRAAAAAPSRPARSWRWSARAPAPPAARSGLPRPRLLLVRRFRRGCERGRDRRNLTSKYLSECLWILEQNWEFIWKKCCDCSQTLLQTDFSLSNRSSTPH